MIICNRTKYGALSGFRSVLSIFFILFFVLIILYLPSNTLTATSQGAAPKGTTSQGAAPKGTTSQGAAPKGTTSQGAAPKGTTSQGAAPKGTTSQGAAPKNLYPDTEITEAVDSNGVSLDPGDKSSANIATFFFKGKPNTNTSSPIVSFQCSLDVQPLQDCGFESRSAIGLSDGQHVFKVRAID